MDPNCWILPLITFVPLVGALIVMFIPKSNYSAIKATSIGISLIPLALSVWVWFAYDRSGPQFPHGIQFGVDAPWIPSLGVSFAMGADGLSVPLIFLTALLTTLSLVYSLVINERPKEYFWMFLLLETGMMGVFVSLDFVLFFVFWEVSLVPMYFLIGIWGGPKREYAAIKFFLYTMVGSMAMLLAILAMYFNGGRTFNMIELAKAGLFVGPEYATVGALVFWGLFLGFAIKVPMFPFHTWLPDAHVEAPTAGSVILAGVLLKMGTYGFMRVLMPMLPEQFERYWWIIAVLSVVAIIYGAFVAMAQWDFKKLIAYSSVNHMGYVTLGCAVAGSGAMASQSSKILALNGAQMQVFSHGLLTGALFLLVGVIYERAHTRMLTDFGGLGARIPVYAGMLSFCSLGSLGLPGMTGFIAELSVLTGTYNASPLLTGLALIGVVVTAAFMLWTIQRVLLGPLNPRWEKMPDADTREVSSVAPLMALTLLFGVMPMLILTIFNGASQAIVGLMH
ncbi:MAG: NADH-quinone oxidoreductase subunit M [Armatimonadetes bacterium]|nr:NADH-quinone oxidoreductase subunit M [Armatimonadota bacterium]